MRAMELIHLSPLQIPFAPRLQHTFPLFSPYAVMPFSFLLLGPWDTFALAILYIYLHLATTVMVLLLAGHTLAGPGLDSLFRWTLPGVL